MKLAITAFLSALIFASGLAISGMTNPNNVIGFLDLTGIWKPALMFVMVGAIFVYSIANYFILKRSRPIFETEFHIPTLRVIDAKLVMGSAVFGIGWGLGGFCPGPAITSVGAGSHDAVIFGAFMLIGMWFQKISKIQN